MMEARPAPPPAPHPSRVTVSGPYNVTGVLPKCPRCPLAEGHEGDCQTRVTRDDVKAAIEAGDARWGNLEAITDAITAQCQDDWQPGDWERWRHGGWYVGNLHYPSGGVGCVSNNYADRKWRIACDPRPFDEQPTFKNRTAAALAERDLISAQIIAGA